MAQVFPQPDTLDHTGTFGTVFGTYLVGYLGTRYDGGTNWAASRLVCLDADVAAGQPDAMCTATSNAYEGKRHGWVRREQVDEVGGANAYVRVAGTFYVRPVALGGLDPSKVQAGYLLQGGCGVQARVVGGTLVEPGGGSYDPVVYLTGPSGYVAYCTQQGSTGQVSVVLERWNAGVRTQLATLTLTPTAPSFLAPWGIQLELQNSATQVVCTVGLTNVVAAEGKYGLGGGGLVTDVPSWTSDVATLTYTTALTYTDTSGSRLASPGRAGIVLDKENRSVAIPGYGVQVDTEAHCRGWVAATTGVVRLQEQWQRSLPRMGEDETTRWANAARWVTCDWAYDRASELFRRCVATPYTGGGNPWNPGTGWQGFPIARDAGHGTGITVSCPVNSPAQEQLAQLVRELPAPTRARHAIDFAHQNVGAGYVGVQVGVVLRLSTPDAVGGDGAAGSTIDNFKGYVFRIGGDGLCEVVRRNYTANQFNANPDDDTVVLATLSIPHSATLRELKAEAVDADTPDAPGTGAVDLRMWVDGTQVVLDSAGVAGVTVAADGTVRDASDGRLPGAVGVGVYVAFPATDGSTTHTVEVRATEAHTPTNAYVPDDALANLSLRTEASNASGTLVWTPSYTLPLTLARPDVRMQYEAGGDYGRSTSVVERQLWRVVAEAVQDSDLQYLEDFYDAHGVEVPFTYTLPGEAAGTYRFTDGLDCTEVVPGLWRVVFELEEVHSAG